MRLFVARHGETSWNAAGRLLGKTPGELTARGREQAAALARRVAELAPTVVYASDLARAAETAHIVEQNCAGVSVILAPEIQERNFGAFEGRTYDEANDAGFWDVAPDKSLEGAETERDFSLRIARFVTMLADKYSDDIVLLICHVGVMNRLRYLADPGHFDFVSYPNAEPVEFELDAILQNSRALIAAHG